MKKVNVIVSCYHVNILEIESVILIPRAGDKIKCQVCGKEVEILRVGKPYEENKTPS